MFQKIPYKYVQFNERSKYDARLTISIPNTLVFFSYEISQQLLYSQNTPINGHYSTHKRNQDPTSIFDCFSFFLTGFFKHPAKMAPCLFKSSITTGITGEIYSYQVKVAMSHFQKITRYKFV